MTNRYIIKTRKISGSGAGTSEYHVAKLANWLNTAYLRE